MSTAQVLYLQHLITTKLRRDKYSPRKILAHQQLQSRLQPLVAEADDKISENQGALCQAIEETTAWLGSESRGRMRGFEQKISMQWNTERLARLNLTDE